MPRSALLLGWIPVAVLTDLAVGLPALLLVAGAVVLAGGLSRVEGLDGTAAWAAAIVAEMVLISGASVAVALVSARDHGRTVDLVVLAVPIAAGLLLLRLPRREREFAVRPPRMAIAMAVVSVTAIETLRIAGRGASYGAAWAMSGDARNHTVIIRSILHSGGLTLAELRAYPAISDGIAGVLSEAGGRTGLAPGHLLLHDAQAMAALYVTLVVAVALLFVACLHELLPNDLTRARLPAAAVIALVGAAATAASPLVLGTSLHDGFLSAYAALAPALASIVLGLRCMRSPSPWTFLLLGPTALLVLLTWTVLAAIPVAVTLLVAGRLLILLRRRDDAVSHQRRLWVTTGTAALLCVLAVFVVVVTHAHELHVQLDADGAVTPPQGRLLWLLGFLVVGACFGARSTVPRLQLLLVVGTLVACGIMVKFLLWLAPSGTHSTYYEAKFFYLACSSFIWVLFLPALRSSVWEGQRSGRLAAATRSGQALALVLAASVVVGWSTPLTSATRSAELGGIDPSAQTVRAVVAAADSGKKFVLWQWSPDERLGNFWGALAYGYDAKGDIIDLPPALPGGIVYWDYTQDGTMQSLCTAARAYPGLNIYTHSATLQTQLNRSCPLQGADVRLSVTP